MNKVVISANHPPSAHAEASTDPTNLRRFISEKSAYISEIICNTVLSIKTNKKYGIFSNNDTNLSITILTDLYEKLNGLDTAVNSNQFSYEMQLDQLQQIVNKLSMIICGFGTAHINDLMFVSFGSEYKNIQQLDPICNEKYKLILRHVRPIGYKLIHWKLNKYGDSATRRKHDPTCNVDKITDGSHEFETMPMFECFDVETNTKSFYHQIHGIRIIVQNETLKKTLIINGVVDDIHVECISSPFINSRKSILNDIAMTYAEPEKSLFMRITETLTLKDHLIYSTNDIKLRLITVITDANTTKLTKIDVLSKKYLEMDIFSQRKMLINLLTHMDDSELQYICFILYDLIHANASISDEGERSVLFDSFPWKIKLQLKDVVKFNLNYTHDMTQKSMISKVSLEQQIYLLKVKDAVKEKAIIKLKEISGKPDEMVVKTKQYLEGLVQIPFGIYKEESILTIVKKTSDRFKQTSTELATIFPEFQLPSKFKYTKAEIENYINHYGDAIPSRVMQLLREYLTSDSLKRVHSIAKDINGFKLLVGSTRIQITRQPKTALIEQIIAFLTDHYQEHVSYISTLYNVYQSTGAFNMKSVLTNITQIKDGLFKLNTGLDNITKVLDDSIYSHSYAKNQILKIFGQWMNGIQGGYCFGFEGSPGIGKTSLAKKGITSCLIDDNGQSRPFAFIALGGSCNGSTLEGHGYTYMNSTWGRIVDILMETKCMNPIIYIDELDKVSKTEHGKEIIGILTHLIDPTQNDIFQDKYFAGIDIDLSKVLFIFSYNDPEQIDKILLDRIHRIKFENLSLDDKKVIVNRYILPEINKKMGFENVINLQEDLVEHIIVNYTIEPGVRKLKEILFDLYGEINIEIMRNQSIIPIPYTLTINDIDNKYLTKYTKFIEKRIHIDSQIGIINGLWANTAGAGGIIPIQTLLYPSSVFLDLQLTGLQGDVMKESMNVARTLAWNLTDTETKKTWLNYFADTKCQGLHIHCPEGSISKDGPSAGAAITTAIYSLLNNKYIKPDVAITGEISLSGEITAIGGLDLKLTGGIRAGIKTFLFPSSNIRDFSKWKINNKHAYADIKFLAVSHISDIFVHVFDENIANSRHFSI